MISVADLRRAALAAKKSDVNAGSPAPARPPLTPADAATTRVTTNRIVTYRHDPYSYTAVTTISAKLAERNLFDYYDAAAAATSGAAAAAAATPSKEAVTAAATVEPMMSSAGFALPVPASKARAAQKQYDQPRSSKSLRETIELSANEEGVSEVSSENGASQPTFLKKQQPHQQIDFGGTSSMCTPTQDAMLTPEEESSLSPDVPAAPNAYGFTSTVVGAGPAPPTVLRLPSVIRYASVNFRFGSAWFIAPFKVSVGDLVVVAYPANNSLHMGLVSSITKTKPATFYSPENPNPDTLTDDEVAILPRLLRHARDFDKETKLDLRTHDLGSLQSARQLAKEMGAPIQFLDAEWLLDLSAITFLVNVYGDDERLVDELADELASVEGAEVVFTYPAVKQQAFY